ncbi:MAG: (4Fe-4S)-binding protein [Clostridia bacterium]|nr:(4Fe-4S)-binding protein [Clostridia bacterium]
MNSNIPKEELNRLKGLGFLSNRGGSTFSARVVTGNGCLTPAQFRHIAEAAERFGNGSIAMTTRLSVELPGIPYEQIGACIAFLAEGGFETGGTGKRVRPIVCCKGTVCAHGLLDSFGIAKEMHLRFYKGYHDIVLPNKFKIAVGGCPNNCVKPSLNDVGVMGWHGGYRITIGGRWGKQQAIGRMLETVYETKEAMMDTVEKAILLFKDQGRDGERFCQTIERIGFEQAEAALNSDDLLRRKQEILDKKTL